LPVACGGTVAVCLQASNHFQCCVDPKSCFLTTACTASTDIVSGSSYGPNTLLCVRSDFPACVTWTLVGGQNNITGVGCLPSSVSDDLIQDAWTSNGTYLSVVLPTLLPLNSADITASTSTTATSSSVAAPVFGSTKSSSSGTSAPTAVPKGSSGLSTGAKAGVAVGVILVAALVAGVIFLFLRFRKNTRPVAAMTTSEQKTRPPLVSSEPKAQFRSYVEAEGDTPRIELAGHNFGNGEGGSRHTPSEYSRATPATEYARTPATGHGTMVSGFSEAEGDSRHSANVSPVELAGSNPGWYNKGQAERHAIDQAVSPPIPEHDEKADGSHDGDEPVPAYTAENHEFEYASRSKDVSPAVSPP
jgi:hypothetical protein